MRASALVLAILLSAAPALGQVQKVQGVAGGYPVRVDVVSGGGGGGDATAANQTIGNTSLATIATQQTDGTQKTQVTSSALPTGAATAAKQPALGMAGHPSADVLSVQGVSGGTAVPVTAAQGAGSGSAATFWYSRITDGTNTMPTMDAAARSGYHRVTDGTNTAAVKAASTAAAASDPSMVVALSPNSPPPKEADITCSATLTNGSPTLTCSTLQGVGALGFYLAYGTGGTIATQATYDGTNYFAVSACPPSAPSSGCVSSLSATGQYVIPLAAYSAVRFSGSGLSGSHTVTARATARTGWVQPTGVTTITASSLPLPTGAANAVAQGSTTSGQTGELMQGAVTTNAPTYTNGQTSPINMGTSGGLRTQQIGDSFTWISSAGSYGIRSGAGILRRIIVGSNVAGGINCYDNTAGSGTVIVSLTTTTSTPFNYVEVGAAFSTGLYCVTTGTGESFTVVYAPAT